MALVNRLEQSEQMEDNDDDDEEEKKDDDDDDDDDDEENGDDDDYDLPSFSPSFTRFPNRLSQLQRR